MLSEQRYPVSPTSCEHHRDFSRLHVLMSTFKSPIGKNLSSPSLRTHVYRKLSQTASVQTTSLFIDLWQLFYQAHLRYLEYYCMGECLIIPTIQKTCNSMWVQVLVHMHMCVHTYGG